MRVTVLMGSDSDWPVMKKAADVLAENGVEARVEVASAHRSPSWVKEIVEAGADVFICGAGGAAHLAGVVAAHTVRPVIGVPINSKLNGLDSLLSTAQMPSGVPVATVAVDGAANAGWLALEILAVADKGLAQKLEEKRRKMESEVREKSKKLKAGSPVMGFKGSAA